MNITITTSSKRIFNILENHIERLSHYMYQSKCTKYTSKNDFIESLYDIALYTSNTNTILETNDEYNFLPNTEQHVIITAGTRATYSKTFTLDSSIFIYP